MIAIDTNLLVFSYRTDSVHHKAAFAAVSKVAEGGGPWAIPWHCIHEFISIATHPKIYKPPSTLDGALTFLESFLASPRLSLLSESPGYFERLNAILLSMGLVGPRIYDARIAALCLHHGVTEIWSADRDFAAFKGLRVRNPLLASS